MTRLVAILLALVALLNVGQPALASPQYQERLPGYAGYCPRIASPGETVTFRVSVANDSPETARGTVVDVILPPGLLIEGRAVYAAPGARAGQFFPAVAASAEAGVAWASTAASDEWRAYTLVVVARVRPVAAGEQLATARVRDADGNLIRRVDGVVYVKPRDALFQPIPVIVDMGVQEVCQTEPTATPTPAPTATPTPTPVPPPFFIKSLALSEAEGTVFSIAVVCVIDPGEAVKRPPASRYVIGVDTPANARIALALGSDPEVSGDGRAARFTLRPDGTADRAAIALRPAPGASRFEAPEVPGFRVSADGIGDLREGLAGATNGCPVDPAIAQALVSAERAARTLQASAPVASEATPQISSTPPATVPSTPARSDSPAAPIGPPTTRPIGPTAASPDAPDEGVTKGVQPDPRAAMLPLLCASGVTLAALAFASIARRAEREV